MKFDHYFNWLQDAKEGITIVRTAEEFKSLRPSPRIVFGSPPAAFPHWYYDDRGAQETGVLFLDGFALYKSHILLRDGLGLNIPQCGIYFGPEQEKVADGSVEKDLPIRRFVGKWVILPGPAYSMYGHWLVDFLPRLYNLISLGNDLTKMRFLIPWNLPEPNLRWLRLLGVLADHIEFFNYDESACEIEHAIVPLGLRGNSRTQPMFRDAAIWMRERVLPGGIFDDGARKLFISRRDWNNASRVLQNEAELATLAEAHGFEIVAPEKLSVEDQVRLFSSAAMIVGDYGSALHNSIFAQPGCAVLAFRGNFGHPGFLQSGLCEVMGQDIGYLFGDTGGSEYKQSYRVQAEDFAKCLDLIEALPR